METNKKQVLIERKPTSGEVWNGIVHEYGRANETLQQNLNTPTQTFYEGYVSGLYASLHFLKALVYGEKIKLPKTPAKPLKFNFGDDNGSK